MPRINVPRGGGIIKKLFGPDHEREFNSTDAFSEAGTEAGIKHVQLKKKPPLPRW